MGEGSSLRGVEGGGGGRGNRSVLGMGIDEEKECSRRQALWPGRGKKKCEGVEGVQIRVALPQQGTCVVFASATTEIECRAGGAGERQTARGEGRTVEQIYCTEGGEMNERRG